MIGKIKGLLQQNILKKVTQKIFNFYNSIETIYPKELVFNEDDRILILAPHPDDEVIGCGGLLLKYTNQCKVICITDGRYGDNNIDLQEMIKIRKNEFTSVMHKLNITDFKFLDIEDTKLKYNYEIFKQIDFDKFDYICIPNSLEQHTDHKAVFELIIKAYRENLIKNNIKILMYEVWGALPLVNFYIDISNNIEEKKELINMYHSQVKHINYADKISSLNNYRGMIASKEYIEGYLIMNIKDLEETLC